MIARPTIESIQDAAHVEDVVGEFVSLKKRGSNLIGLCPFHDEKTPSFVVSPAKGIYKCFGCGKSGDAVKFVMEHETYSYPQALRFLAEKYSIAIEEKEVSPEEQIIADQKDSLYIVLKYAAEFFEDQLYNTDEGRSVGLSYFKDRGFLEETMKTFGLGYSPGGWDQFYQSAVAKGYNPDYLDQAGLIKRRDDKVFDFFRGRVMFPIHNVTGKVVAFGGRILKKNEKAPKYINTPETDVYHKSKLVYGIYQARQEIRRKEEALLVEGYTDVISLHQAGIKNVVASSGTSLTPDQVRLIRRHSPNITLLFDGDKAGIKAALRGVDILLEADVNVRVILLPDGEDPDSYLRQVGSAAFEQYLTDHKQDFVLFKLELLLEESQRDPIKRAAIIKDISQSISRIKDGIQRAVYVRECSRLLEIDERLLIQEINKLRRKDLRDHEDQRQHATQEEDLATADPALEHQQAQPETNNYEILEREIVRILLHYGQETIEDKSVASFLFDILKDLDFQHGVYSVILNAFREALEKESTLDLTSAFQTHEESEIREACMDILAPGYELSENWFTKHEVLVSHQDEDLARVVKQAAYRYKSKRFMDMLRMLDEHLKTETEYEKQLELLNFRKKFEAEKNELHDQLGTDVLR